jgi:primosomal protein N''
MLHIRPIFLFTAYNGISVAQAISNLSQAIFPLTGEILWGKFDETFFSTNYKMTANYLHENGFQKQTLKNQIRGMVSLTSVRNKSRNAKNNKIITF